MARNVYFQGPQGIPGAGIIAGGNTGDALTKLSGTDFDTGWVAPADATTISTTQMASLGSDQINALTTTAITSLTDVLPFVALTTTQVASLTETSIAALTTTAIVALTKTLDLTALTTTQLVSLDITQISSLSDNIAQLELRTTTQIAALSYVDITSSLTASLASLETLTTTQMAALTGVEIAALTTTATVALAQTLPIASFTTTQIQTLTTTQIAALTVTQVAPLNSVLPVMVGDTGAGGVRGLVPAPESGDGSKFLRGDGDWVTPAGSGTTFIDNVFRIQDDGDNTKQIAFEASGIATGNIRTITMPDADVDLGNLGGGGGNLTTTQMANLTGVEIAAITTTALAGLTGDQVATLQSELGIPETAVAVTSTAGAVTINLAVGNTFVTTLTENITAITITGTPVSGNFKEFAWYVIKGETAYTITWPTDGNHIFRWTNNALPQLGATNLFKFFTTDSATPWTWRSSPQYKESPAILTSEVFEDIGEYRIHTIKTDTSDKTFSVGVSDITFDILLVGGGGCGGQAYGGGGGGGGEYFYKSQTLGIGSYTVTIGAGGIAVYDTTNWPRGASGGQSSITGPGTNIIAVGGGGGGVGNLINNRPGGNGGSGGGGAGFQAGGPWAGGTSTATGPYGFGNDGGTGVGNVGYGGTGGGGGAGSVGVAGVLVSGNTYNGGNGGAGKQCPIDSNYYAAGGGGGCKLGGVAGVGGSGIGGSGNIATGAITQPVADTGSGGGGAHDPEISPIAYRSGAAGIFKIRYLLPV